MVDGSDEFEGRVEMCFRGVWGTVCDNGWDDRDAEVVCRQLGHITTGAQAFRVSAFGEGTGDIHLSNVDCTGSEERLLSCPQSTPGVNDCIHFEDASVRCGAPEGDYN